MWRALKREPAATIRRWTHARPFTACACCITAAIATTCFYRIEVGNGRWGVGAIGAGVWLEIVSLSPKLSGYSTANGLSIAFLKHPVLVPFPYHDRAQSEVWVVPLWPLIVIALVESVRQDRSRAKARLRLAALDVCVKCKYPLARSGASANGRICPECGTNALQAGEPSA